MRLFSYWTRRASDNQTAKKVGHHDKDNSNTKQGKGIIKH